MIYVFSSTILSPGLFINLFTCLLSNISQLVSLSIYLVCLFVCQFVGQKFNLPIYCIISTRFCIYQPLFFSSFLSVCPTGSQFVWQFVCLFGIITVLFFSYTFWQFFHLSVSLSVCSEMSMKSGVFCTFFLEFANFSRYVWGGFQKYLIFFIFVLSYSSCIYLLCLPQVQSFFIFICTKCIYNAQKVYECIQLRHIKVVIILVFKIKIISYPNCGSH